MITSPFNNRTEAAEVVQGHDLTGKVVLITGANSGIGVETARALLQAGAEVILAVRDTEKGQTVAQELSDSTHNSPVSVLNLDLTSLASIRQAAEEFLQKWPKLDILIDNAGVMATPFSHTSDGFEMQFGTNHLGHFLLTNLLLPALLKATPARVVVLTSGANDGWADIHWADIQFQNRPYNRWEAYAQSKLANILFAVGLTQRYQSQGLTANAVNPGAIKTGLQEYVSQEEWIAGGWMDAEGNLALYFKSLSQGAATSVWAAVGSELEGVGGRYLSDCQEAMPWSADSPRATHQPYVLDPAEADRLWTLSEELVGLTK